MHILILWSALPSPFQELAICSEKSRKVVSYMQPFYFTDFPKKLPHPVFFWFVLWVFLNACSTRSVQGNNISCFKYRYFVFKIFFQNTKLV